MANSEEKASLLPATSQPHTGQNSSSVNNNNKQPAASQNYYHFGHDRSSSSYSTLTEAFFDETPAATKSLLYGNNNNNGSADGIIPHGGEAADEDLHDTSELLYGNILREPVRESGRTTAAVVSVAVFAQTFLLLYFDFLVVNYLWSSNCCKSNDNYVWISFAGVKTLVGLCSLIVSCCFCLTYHACCISIDALLISMDMIINVIFFVFHVMCAFNLGYFGFEVFVQLQSGYVVVAMILLFCVITIQVSSSFIIWPCVWCLGWLFLLILFSFSFVYNYYDS